LPPRPGQRRRDPRCPLRLRPLPAAMGERGEPPSWRLVHRELPGRVNTWHFDPLVHEPRGPLACPGGLMADTRNADLTFGATDYLVHMAALNTASPTDFADLATPWQCLGWVTTEGGLFTVEEETQDVNAAGSLEPRRTPITRSAKSVQVTFLEGLNPLVRSLYDNVPVTSLQPTDGIVSYDLPDKPDDLRYAFVFDKMDGDKKMRLYMPNGKVVERG